MFENAKESSKSVISILSKLFTDLEKEHGNDTVNKQATRALAGTFEEISCQEAGTFSKMFEQFLSEIKSATPQPTSFLRVLERISSSITGADDCQRKKAALAACNKEIERQKSVLDSIKKVGAKLFEAQKCILIRSYSNTMLAVIEGAIEHGVPPVVILAAQEKAKTQKLVRFLRKNKLEHIAIDEFALSHVIPDVDFALFGALSVTNRSQLMVASGLMSMIAALRKSDKECYVAISLEKIQPLSSDIRSVQVKEKEVKYGDEKVKKYFFSHDLVPLNLISGFITERGILSAEEILEIQKDPN